MQDDVAFFPRRLALRIEEAMTDTPAILLVGPRQSGKTMLVRQFAGDDMRYVTLDDGLALDIAQHDPVSLLRGQARVIIDEVQRAPGLLLAIKKSIDENRKPGRFLLTGSANVMTLPTVADSLAGRMESLTLLPLAQSEMRQGGLNWLDCVFAGESPAPRELLLGDALREAVLRGGYPEAVARPALRRLQSWARGYAESILKRDVRELASIERLDQLPRFFQLLAESAGQLCNYTQIGAPVGINYKTAARYTGFMEQVFLLKRVEVWSRNRMSRVVKTPKMQFMDSGLLAAHLAITPAMLAARPARFGMLLESFVFGELLKHANTAEGRYQIMFYRDHYLREVDFVIENAAGQVIGVEVKAAASLSIKDFDGLKHFAQIAGDAFLRGIVLYDGDEMRYVGENLLAMPMSSLWA
ncbi:MAG: ATP-binding protein [Azoarcus sp.]|jgi:predicted AAA+ superfamily ATPase|nr:ATP-binding protein [Azoarcus sp.]